MDYYFIFILISVIITESRGQYEVLEEPSTWRRAKRRCQRQSMSLIVYDETDEDSESLMDTLIDGQTYWTGNHIANRYSMVLQGCYSKPKENESKRVDTHNECFALCKDSLYVGVFIKKKGIFKRLRCYCLEEIEPSMDRKRCDRDRTMFLYEKVFSVMALDINDNVTEAHRCKIQQCGNSTSEDEECDQESFKQCRNIKEVTKPELNITAAGDCRQQSDNSFTKIQYVCRNEEENITSIPLFEKIDKDKIYTDDHIHDESRQFCLQITKLNNTIHKEYVWCNLTAYGLCEAVTMNKEEPAYTTTDLVTSTRPGGSGPDAIDKNDRRNPGILLAVGITVGIIFAVVVFISVCVTYACMKRRMVKKNNLELRYTQSQRNKQDRCSEYSNVYDVVEDVATSCSIEGSSNLRKMDKLKHANERERFVGYNPTYLRSVGEMDDDEYLKPALPSRPSVDIHGSKQTTICNNLQQTTRGNNFMQNIDEDNYDHMQDGLLIENKKDTCNIEIQTGVDILPDDIGGEYFILCPKEEVEQEQEFLLNEKNAKLNDRNSKNQEKLITEDESQKIQNGEYVQLTGKPENVTQKQQESEIQNTTDMES